MSFCLALSICLILNDMPNFSIRFQYTKSDVVHYKNAIVRASSLDMAKEKLVSFFVKHVGVVDRFKVDKISLSNFDFCIN